MLPAGARHASDVIRLQPVGHSSLSLAPRDLRALLAQCDAGLLRQLRDGALPPCACRRDAPPEQQRCAARTFEFNSRRLSRGVAACSLADASWPYYRSVITPMPFSNRVAAATKTATRASSGTQVIDQSAHPETVAPVHQGATLTRRSKSFIVGWFSRAVSVADDCTDRHCRLLTQNS